MSTALVSKCEIAMGNMFLTVPFTPDNPKNQFLLFSHFTDRESEAKFTQQAGGRRHDPKAGIRSQDPQSFLPNNWFCPRNRTSSAD